MPAAKLGIARSTLESKIRSLTINKNRYKHLESEITQTWMFVRTAAQRPVVLAI